MPNPAEGNGSRPRGQRELFQDRFDDENELDAALDSRIGLDAAIDQFQQSVRA
jgi:hypothetical protein